MKILPFQIRENFYPMKILNSLLVNASILFISSAYASDHCAVSNENSVTNRSNSELPLYTKTISDESMSEELESSEELGKTLRNSLDLSKLTLIGIILLESESCEVSSESSCSVELINECQEKQVRPKSAQILD